MKINKTVLWLILGLAFNLVHADDLKPNNLYPDKTLTPGVIDPNVTVEQLCTHGYTATIRNVSQATKHRVFEEYNIPLSESSKYEVDHLMSLENGGLNDILNLWPEPYCPVGNDPLVSQCWGAREKDRVETALHRWLCRGEISLKDDQEILRTDWVACYKQIKAGEICTPNKK
jgi:hypothetical protein